MDEGAARRSGDGVEDISELEDGIRGGLGKGEKTDGERGSLVPLSPRKGSVNVLAVALRFFQRVDVFLGFLGGLAASGLDDL